MLVHAENGDLIAQVSVYVFGCTWECVCWDAQVCVCVFGCTGDCACWVSQMIVCAGLYRCLLENGANDEIML